MKVKKPAVSLRFLVIGVLEASLAFYEMNEVRHMVLGKSGKSADEVAYFQRPGWLGHVLCLTSYHLTRRVIPTSSEVGLKKSREEQIKSDISL